MENAPARTTLSDTCMIPVISGTAPAVEIEARCDLDHPNSNSALSVWFRGE